MPYAIERVDVFTGCIDDKPGALAAMLAPLAEAKVCLQFLLARRNQPGRGVVFAAPIKGAAAARAAQKAGLSKDATIAALRVEGPDKAGLGVLVTQAIAAAGINLRGISALAAGKKAVLCIALDSAADAAKARAVLKKVLGTK